MNIIPAPVKVEIISDNRTPISSIGFGNNLLSDEAKKDFLDFCKLSEGETNIFFENDASLDEEEYALKTEKGEVKITSSSASGQLYALQTLKQILFENGFSLPDLEIYDKPTHKIRGFMLDVGRYFYTVEEVKTFIRRMAMHKLNLFHFHLTEDQGWRIQIDAFPLLTEIGSKRTNTNFDRVPREGYYTKADIKEIVDYAHAFCIKVMPEFDIPGHSRAAIACYKELTCFERDLPVATHWGVKHDVLCVGKESTFDFVYKVIDEMCEMFPDEYFHIGGDEVPKHRWDLCPHCQAKRKELGLSNSDALQFWFMNKVKDYCKAKGKQAFMWSWELESDKDIDGDLGFTLCDGDSDIGDRPYIDTSTKAYYIDLPYGYINLKDTADSKTKNRNCLGLEVTLWTEYVKDMKKADYMTYPRLGAFCENAWNGGIGYEAFSKKLDYYYSLLDYNKIGYAKPHQAMPNKIRKPISVLWFERRQLAWEGLHNIFDDKAIEKMAKAK